METLELFVLQIEYCGTNYLDELGNAAGYLEAKYPSPSAVVTKPAATTTTACAISSRSFSLTLVHSSQSPSASDSSWIKVFSSHLPFATKSSQSWALISSLVYHAPQSSQYHLSNI
ncbi:hypothetical protein GGR50DRAFT_692785 [Xylaria sp. CBS 124048]|nr:hypothetical protein GGR50DRAFT_692785 [Xylaria sp. CBS 124048]